MRPRSQSEPRLRARPGRAFVEDLLWRRSRSRPGVAEASATEGDLEAGHSWPPIIGEARRVGADVPSKRELLRLFLREKSDPEPFYVALARLSVAELPVPIRNQLILDLGCGAGHYAFALEAAGAEVVPIELSEASLRSSGSIPRGALAGSAEFLPFPASTFDGVFCSNMLEHAPDPEPVLNEISRTLRPGGWAWISWTNWYSPWGGHEIVPFHYLGPQLGLKVWRCLFGEPRKNVPFVELWPTHIGDVLSIVRSHNGLRLVDAYPRYYPSQRWILGIRGLRELLTWNCALVIERTH